VNSTVTEISLGKRGGGLVNRLEEPDQRLSIRGVTQRIDATGAATSVRNVVDDVIRRWRTSRNSAI
jgi:hypothetical protein